MSEYKRLVCLDYGSAWIGVAHTDPMQFFAKPYATWMNKDLEKKLEEYLKAHSVEAVIIGLPITMKGNESQQTTEIKKAKELLEKKFPLVVFLLHDERMSSIQAQKLKKINRNDEYSEHAIAASFILESFLTKKNI
jgi:putative Holliday junction resolvase